MIDHEQQFLLQAEENARLQAAYAAEVERIADEIIDKILAEEPGRALRLARRADAGVSTRAAYRTLHGPERRRPRGSTDMNAGLPT